MLHYISNVLDHWPTDRSVEAFHAWFEARFVIGIVDLAGEPIKVWQAD
jgi:hypothetical protein